MDTDAKGQLGGIECSREARLKMAGESGAYTCAVCKRSNAEIMRETEEAAKAHEATEGKHVEESVPEELRLAYRDELEGAGGSKPKAEGRPEPEPDAKGEEEVDASPAASLPAAAPARTAPPVTPTPPPAPTRTVPAQAPNPQRVQRESSLAWIDACIYGVLAALLFMLLRKVI